MCTRHRQCCTACWCTLLSRGVYAWVEEQGPDQASQPQHLHLSLIQSWNHGDLKGVLPQYIFLCIRSEHMSYALVAVQVAISHDLRLINRCPTVVHILACTLYSVYISQISYKLIDGSIRRKFCFVWPRQVGCGQIRSISYRICNFV